MVQGIMELLAIIYFICLCLGLGSGQQLPKYVLPLGNTTVYREVMSGRDAHLPPSNQCFVFSAGHPDLPYEAITLTGEDNSYVDLYLNGQVDFRDFTLSIYLYPIGEPDGTILNYLCETGNVIKLSVLEGLLFVSFWDEYGVSVGATAIPQLLIPNEWNHLAVSREFASGRIKIHHNAELVDDIDDDFPNKIRLPTKGSIRLGSSQKDKEEPRFKGRFACFQMYLSVLTDREVVKSKDFCLPTNWNIPPEVTLESKQFDGVDKMCVTDYEAPPLDGVPEPKDCTIISPACLYSGHNWNVLKKKHNWKEGNRNSAHFHLVGRNFTPKDNTDDIVGDVLMYTEKSCPTLCLRLFNCKAFYYHQEDTNTTRCVMYKDSPGNDGTITQGAVLFSLV